MIINHNLPGMNAIRNMNANSAAASKSMQKLSSGLAINSAADNAAGLAISEKMRGQIRGLDQASANAQDGISLTQTAEGALNETTSILQRMRELAVQSSNDTATDADRGQMQLETKQLSTEIDRIANTTQFNTKNLLNGNLSTGTVAQGTVANTVALKSGGSLISGTGSTTTLQSLADANGNNFGLKGGDVVNLSGLKNGSAISGSFTVAGNTTTSADVSDGGGNINANIANTDTLSFSYNGQTYTTGTLAAATGGTTTMATVATDIAAKMNAAAGSGADITVTNSGGKLVFASASGKDVQATGSTNAGLNTGLTVGETNGTTTHLSDLLTAVNNMTGGTSAINAAGQIVVTGANGTANSLSDIKLNVANRDLFNNQLSSLKETQAAQDTHTDSSLNLQIGANEGQTMKVDINNMGVQALSLSSVDVSTQQGAETATTVVDNAIQKVSTERAKLGAFQNRLEHTIANLGTSSENLTASESRIRDVDMAKEMATFSKNNILAQAAQAMIAQANQQPQQVLQLLR
ncbi:flagellin [Neobacillus sp. PS3-12]|uniref:flagellin N-terminal helical domain-containing protein n=1 Tax=Neobacillus sp. PS3-12 TaxID=3070677 RepID=UPI0027E0B9E9|nr:flagellin [Neobacillus sp. PS3-12]WML54749.1 flagellin [Neobacillus sp. PS3-12]